MRHSHLKRIQRLLLTIALLALIGIGVIAARVAGYGLPTLSGIPAQGVNPAAFDRSVALISGHAGYDSGAVCIDEEGNVEITEIEIVDAIARLAARRLRRAGADVLILDEYDARLTGLQADLLLSLHADSCIAEASGFKAARHVTSAIPRIDDQIIGCINARYAEATALPNHPTSVTHDMTDYHAFSRIAAQTPAAILEMGFLGADQETLVARREFVAWGISESVLCFLEQQSRQP